MPKQVIPAANLLAPQWGAAAAVSVLGLGVASQMWGLWAGAIAGALDANTRLKPATKDENVAVPPVAVDVDALRTIIRKKAEHISPKVVDVPVVQVKAPVASKAPVQSVAVKTVTVRDDLKLISGVGPKLEQVLNGMGIQTYAQIAAWTVEEIARVDDHLKFGGRILRDDWVGQAAALAGASTN
ncbi:NADH-ubiquinone dehydrogenase [Phyllobacterium zundukense]|nr:NADH-ubiquinone dehydrogenase [Phyllobacterium zundukense]